MLSSSLPVCAAFRSESSGKYLRYRADDAGAAGGSKQLLELSGDDAVNPYTRFYIEPSTKHDALVHVRCCYNNKYWVAKQRLDDDSWWIAGGADEPEEDVSQQSCTLFQLKPVGEDPNTIRFIHARLGKCSAIVSDSSDQANGAFQACLCVRDDQEQSEPFTMVALHLRVLPKHVCFKGDNDIADPEARHTTTTDSNGTAMRIKSDYSGLFWRRRAPIMDDYYNWVLADSTGTSDGDPNTLFEAFLLDNDEGTTIALFNLGNNLYCKRFSTETYVHGFSPMEQNTFAPEAKILLQEPVVYRGITIVQYAISHATVYNEGELMNLATASATNYSSSPRKVRLAFELTLTETQRWYSSMTLRSPVLTTIISSQVPSMVEGQLVLGPSHFTAMYSWGATNGKSTLETVEQFVDLPPMTKVTATCRARTSSYDVPFSYRQGDTLIGGEEVTLEFDDGIYTGRNIHSLVYEYKNEKLSE